MHTIQGFDISGRGSFTLELQAWHKLLPIRVINDQPTLFVQQEYGTDELLVEVQFYVFRTGEQFDGQLTYVGSFAQGEEMYHVFKERLRDANHA
jgi:hypothetical protein